MAEKEQKERRRQELAEERAAKAAKEREVYAAANAEGIPHHMIRIIKGKSVKNIVDAGRKKHVATTKKAVKNAEKAAKGAPPSKMIKDELLRLGYKNKEIGRLAKNATLSGVLRKAEERRQKEVGKAAKNAAEQALKQKLRDQLGNNYSSAEFKKPRKGQSENNLLRAFQKRVGTKKAKELKASEELAIKMALKLEDFNNANIKYKKGNTLSAHRVAAEKRKTARLAKGTREGYMTRLKQAALDAGLPASALKVRGKLTASAQNRLLANARKRVAAKTQKNAIKARIADLKTVLLNEGYPAKNLNNYLKFVGKKSDEVLLAEARKRAAVKKHKNTVGTRKQQIIDVLAPLGLTKEEIKKTVCLKSF
jgi:hypothetical protein